MNNQEQVLNAYHSIGNLDKPLFLAIKDINGWNQKFLVEKKLINIETSVLIKQILGNGLVEDTNEN